jgi:predicted Ser/Thr protein kinase
LQHQTRRPDAGFPTFSPFAAAIGEPEMVDTAKDRAPRPHLHEPHHPVYPAFAEFYGMEETIERIVSFFRHAAQGLEERKQILYLLGPSAAASRRWPSV